jgi:Rrf2 family protein
MKLSRTAGYAIHALLYIARHNADGRPIIGHAAAKELDIPQGFLLRLLVALSRAGLLRSVKGPNGGYNLARPAKAITLLDIIEAVEGPFIGRADPTKNPPDALDKRLEAVSAAATDSMRREFSRVTVADLAGSGKKVR